MHKYMRSIGFSKITDRKELQKLITDVILEGTDRSYTSSGEDGLLAEFCRDFAEDSSGASIGIACAVSLTVRINLLMIIIFPI